MPGFRPGSGAPTLAGARRSSAEGGAGGSGRRAERVAWVLAALYLLALAYPTHLRVVGAYWTEIDFYIYWAPDADRIAAREFPQHPNNPPGYALLLSLISRLTGDHFVSGKWLSLVCGALTGVLAFYLFRRLFGPAPALLAVAILYLSGEYTRYSIQATTDVPFTCLVTAAILLMTGERPSGWRYALLAGALSALAYLLRSNGITLLAPALAGALHHGRTPRHRAVLAGLVLVAFLLVAAPWLWLNYTHRGSPFATQNYIDIAVALYGGDAGAQSLRDVVATDPLRFALAYARSLAITVGQLLGASLAVLPVGPLAVLGFAICFRYPDWRVRIVQIATLAFVGLLALTHWETRYYLFVGVCWCGFAALSVFEVARGLARWLGRPRAAPVVVTLLALWILIPSSGRAWTRVRGAVERQALEVLPPARYLDRTASPGATVMAVMPHIAYLSRRPWREFPNATSVEELGDRLRPAPPDYLVYERKALQLRRELKALATPGTGTPTWLRPVYHDPAVPMVIYAVELPRGR